MLLHELKHAFKRFAHSATRLRSNPTQAAYHQAWKQQGASNPNIWQLLNASKRGKSCPYGSFRSTGAYFDAVGQQRFKAHLDLRLKLYRNVGFWSSRNTHYARKLRFGQRITAFDKKRRAYLHNKLHHYIPRTRCQGVSTVFLHRFFCPEQGKFRFAGKVKNSPAFHLDSGMRQRLSEKCKEKRRLRSAFRECASRDARAPNRPANSLLLSSIKRSKELKSSARAAVNSEADTRKASVANAPARRPVIGPNAHRTSMRSPVALRSHGSIHMRALGTVARRHENNPSSQQTLEGVCLSLLRPFRMLGLDRVLASIRVSLSLLPLGLSKSAIYGISRLRLLLWLLAPPLAVLVTVLAANAERTPFTGRWRIPLLAATQQQQLFEQFIQHSGRGDSGEIDWSQILRKMLRAETTSPNTLFCGQILSRDMDWRVDWVNAVLRGLESGLDQANGAILSGSFFIPPTQYPTRSHQQHPVYTALVVDNPGRNAFSFGWPHTGKDAAGRATHQPSGVIVVYTGFLDWIMQSSSTGPQRSSALVSTNAEDFLQVLLAHELSHLILGHAVEHYSYRNHFWPKMISFGVDTARGLLYPITSMLGPFFNDAINSSLSLLAATAPKAEQDSWLFRESSQALEVEADLLSLRLLAAASADPHRAIDFWQARASSQNSTDEFNLTAREEQSKASRFHYLYPHSSRGREQHRQAGEDAVYLQTHPQDADRLVRIREQLEVWQKGRSLCWALEQLG